MLTICWQHLMCFCNLANCKTQGNTDREEIRLLTASTTVMPERPIMAAQEFETSAFSVNPQNRVRSLGFLFWWLHLQSNPSFLSDHHQLQKKFLVETEVAFFLLKPNFCFFLKDLVSFFHMFLKPKVHWKETMNWLRVVYSYAKIGSCPCYKYCCCCSSCCHCNSRLCAAVCCRCLSISLSVCDLHFAKCVMMHDVHW